MAEYIHHPGTGRTSLQKLFLAENGGIMRNGSVEGTKFAQPAALSHLIYGWFRLPALCLAYKAVYITIIEVYTYYRSDSQRQALRTHWISTPLCSSQSCFT
ncbi:uncharacterized protein [Drosophila virilis]|uniref:Uncharacterized protein, isoform B n=1 Tax=Drosophila virilis TaxID=7244 RepID=A0A0Q9W705_DROVI|nr:uncharacterized protein LOC26531344 isoform X2 [Drosophila virilis]KRF80498.1 uncharacterized protein Dvir_GJ26574, isoform B [Drosophila virilis]